MQSILCLETTCDETAAAVIRRDRTVLADAVASQMEVHEDFQGVVPELAARAHLERITPIVSQVFEESAIDPEADLEAVAVCTQPGLPGSLLVGLAAAKALCVAWNKPLVTINHVQAHIYACGLDRNESVFPCVGMVVSGGHTNFYECHSPEQWTYLGGTIDDAVGEAFDKVAVMLGLGYPGGPEISRLALQGDPKAFQLPRPMLNQKDSMKLSFSGLKTAVRYQIVGVGKQDFSAVEISHQMKCDLAASFQQAAIDCLVGKAKLALRQTKLKRLCVGGGVAANVTLREALQSVCDSLNCELVMAPAHLCTDNAVMGAIAWEQVDAGCFAKLDVDIQPGLLRS